MKVARRAQNVALLYTDVVIITPSLASYMGVTSQAAACGGGWVCTHTSVYTYV